MSDFAAGSVHCSYCGNIQHDQEKNCGNCGKAFPEKVKTQSKNCIAGFFMVLVYVILCSICWSISMEAAFMVEVYAAPLALIGIGLCIVGLKSARDTKKLSIVLGIVGIVLFVYSAGMFVNTVFMAELSKILSQLTPV